MRQTAPLLQRLHGLALAGQTAAGRKPRPRIRAAAPQTAFYTLKAAKRAIRFLKLSRREKRPANLGVTLIEQTPPNRSALQGAWKRRRKRL
jgi:hypothetical protein